MSTFNQPGTWGPINSPSYPNYTYNPNIHYPPQPYSGTGSHLYTSQQPQGTHILRALGPESAKAYPMGPNETVVIFDANEAIFYLVSTDDSSFKSMRTFDFTERKQAEAKPVLDNLDVLNFATKDDLAEIKNELTELANIIKGLM